MVEEEVGSFGAVEEVEEGRGGVRGAAIEEGGGAEGAEGGVEVAEALGEPPAGDAAGVEGALLLGGPDEHRDDVASAHRSRQRRVVFHAEVAPEPHDALLLLRLLLLLARRRRRRSRHILRCCSGALSSQYLDIILLMGSPIPFQLATFMEGSGLGALISLFLSVFVVFFFFYSLLNFAFIFYGSGVISCVCVCVGERERERERWGMERNG